MEGESCGTSGLDHDQPELLDSWVTLPAVPTAQCVWAHCRGNAACPCGHCETACYRDGIWDDVFPRFLRVAHSAPEADGNSHLLHPHTLTKITLNAISRGASRALFWNTVWPKVNIRLAYNDARWSSWAHDQRGSEVVQGQLARILGQGMWPGNCLDLNTIEYVWSIVKRKVARHGLLTTTGVFI